MEVESKFKEYLKLFEKVRDEVGSDEVAMAIVEQVGKDHRVTMMHGAKLNPETTSSGSGDTSATGKQIGFLKALGVEIPEGLTKQRASELIDEAQAKAVAK